MRIHVITPFYRKHLLPTIINYLKFTGIEWYPVCDEIDIRAFDSNDELWIHPILCAPLNRNDHAVRKLNDFIDVTDIIDDDYYGFCGDDDGYEPGFFDTIRRQSAKIIFTSLSRGDTIPNGAHPHPTYPLIIRGPEDVKPCNIGLCQFVIKGEILRQMRFHNKHNYDDGLFAQELKDRFPNDCVYLPDLFSFGNYLEPGRYTSDAWKIKPHWRLPEYA